MILNFSLFALSFIGSAMVFSGLFPRVLPAAKRAVAARAGKKETLSSVISGKIAVKLLRLISLDTTKRQKLKQTLIVLGKQESPELFHAKAWANGIVYAAGILALLPVVHMMIMLVAPDVVSTATIYQAGALLAAAMLFIGKQTVHKELSAEWQKRQEAIEWELPQFSGTILQSLGHTRNVQDILTSYKKICGAALEREIERTLNDMVTGNREQAIENLASRVNSGAFTQLAQGLIGMLRGDDQKNYFQIITNDFYNTQSELIEKQLLKRPGKLTVNNALLLVGMIAMYGVAIVGYVMDTSSGLF